MNIQMVKLSLRTTQSAVKKWSQYNTVGSGPLRLNGTIWGFFRSGIGVTHLLIRGKSIVYDS